MNCPRCQGHLTGRIALDHYYCWECCIEYRIKGETALVYEVDEEGELLLTEEAPLATRA